MVSKGGESLGKDRGKEQADKQFPDEHFQGPMAPGNPAMVRIKPPEAVGFGEEWGRKQVADKVLSRQKQKRRHRFEPGRLLKVGT